MVSNEIHIHQSQAQRLPDDPASLPYEHHSPYSGTQQMNARKTGFARRFLLFLSRHPRLHMLGLESRNFAHRIGIVLNSNDSHRVPIGPVWVAGPGVSSRVNTHAIERSEYIQRLASSRPWETPLDWKAHLESWEQGAEWAFYNQGNADKNDGMMVPDSEWA